MINSLLVLFVSTLFANGLPKHFKVQDMKLPMMAQGKRVPIKTEIQIPNGYKVSEETVLKVFEKQRGQWVLVE